MSVGRIPEHRCRPSLSGPWPERDPDISQPAQQADSDLQDTLTCGILTGFKY